MQRIKKIAFVKLHDIWFETETFYKSNSNVVCLHTNEELPNEKYDFVLNAKTFLLEIDKNEEELIQGMEAKSCRYPIRKSIKDGVIVRQAKSVDEFNDYISFQNDFCKEKEIPFISSNELNDLQVFYANSADGEYLGGCAFVVSDADSTVRYKYGATLHKLNANEAILWKAICYYSKQGFKYFDFGGCIPTEDKDSYYYRHYHFKKKFGGKLIDSFSYFKIKGPARIIYVCANLFIKLFFKGDVNGAIVWLNKMGFIGDK